MKLLQWFLYPGLIGFAMILFGAILPILAGGALVIGGSVIVGSVVISVAILAETK